MNYRKLVNAGKAGSILQSAARLGAMGAVVGGTISAIGNTYKVAKGEQKSAEAVANVAKETVGTGVSTATAAATMTALGMGGLLGLAGFTVVATLMKGFMDSILYCEEKQTASE